MVHFEEIYSKGVERLQVVNEIRNFLRANILGIFISGFSCNFSLTKTILEKNNQLDFVLQSILQPTIYTTLYDRKVKNKIQIIYNFIYLKLCINNEK